MRPFFSFFALLSLLLPGAALADLEFPRVISAEGNAEVRLAPDRAAVRVGVQHQAPTAQQAQSAANDAMRKIVDALRRLGVAPERLRSDRIDLQPVHSYSREDGESRLVGFRATNKLRVELHLGGEGPEVGPVLDAAISAGANQIDGIHFYVADETEAQARALAQAAQNAREQARAIAASLGVELGELLSASEGVQASPFPAPGLALRTMEAAPATPVEPGEVVVQAIVQVRYGIRD